MSLIKVPQTVFFMTLYLFFICKKRVIKMKKNNYNSILAENEAAANSLISKIYLIMFGVLTLILVLNKLDIFILEKTLLERTYVIGSFLLLIPLAVNFLFRGKRFLKYYNTFTAVAVISLFSYTFTYHVIIVAFFPILIANIYFIRKMNIWAVSLTVVLNAFMQAYSFLNGRMTDKNYTSLSELVIFGIIPNTILLLAMGIVFTLLSERTAALLKSFSEQVEEVENAHNRTVYGFANIVESRDNNTGGHVKRTSRYVEMISRELYKEQKYTDTINEDFIKELMVAAPLHDVGKITVPDNVLLKEGKLNDEEYTKMKKHTEEGGKMILNTFSSRDKYESMAYDVAVNHHEKWNGKGYPEGKKGEEIPLAARIMAVADVFDALSQDRCYRKALSLDECYEIIGKDRGEAFDPEIVDAFFNIRDDIEKVMSENK